jgi:hypothetical protein
MSAGPGGAGLRWFWDAVASLRPGGLSEAPLRPAPDHDGEGGAGGQAGPVRVDGG